MIFIMFIMLFKNWGLNFKSLCYLAESNCALVQVLLIVTEGISKFFSNTLCVCNIMKPNIFISVKSTVYHNTYIYIYIYQLLPNLIHIMRKPCLYPDHEELSL